MPKNYLRKLVLESGNRHTVVNAGNQLVRLVSTRALSRMSVLKFTNLRRLCHATLGLAAACIASEPLTLKT